MARITIGQGLWQTIYSYLNSNFLELYDYVTDIYDKLTHTGDVTGTKALTLNTVNSNVGSFKSADITVNAKGLVTAATKGVADAFQSVTFASPLAIDATTYKDFICASVTGSTVVNLTNAVSGDAGLIELIIDGTGGYTVTLGTMFTKDIAGVAISAVANADNFIGWRKVGTDIVYSVTQKV
jgi:hypothetical protein